MCATFKIRGVEFRPGREAHAIGSSGEVKAVWAGFARSEILAWWLSKGGILLDIPATEFSERSETDGSLRHQTIPDGLVIRALLDFQTGGALLKIVTRPATPSEFEHFQHPRHPVLEAPLHHTAEITIPDVAAHGCKDESPSCDVFMDLPLAIAPSAEGARSTRPARTSKSLRVQPREVQELLFAM
jgi:hypothetical protein